MKIFGLPTYPVSDGMELGKRDSDEVAWLLEHGVLVSHLRGYRKLVRSESDPEPYQLIRMSAVPTSSAVVDDETLEKCTDLPTLLQTLGDKDKYGFTLSKWHWHATIP